jgi:hypothetical protein
MMDAIIRTIFIRDKVNPLLRVLSIIYYAPMIVVIFAMIYWIDHEMTIQSIVNYLQLCAFVALLLFFRDYNKMKYYLYNVEILPDGEIYFEYYSWFKLVKAKYPINQIDIRYEQVVSHYVRIIVNRKTIIKQFQGGWGSLEKLDRKTLRQFYEDMKSIIHEHKISTPI